jgi:hypothetical protein
MDVEKLKLTDEQLDAMVVEDTQTAADVIDRLLEYYDPKMTQDEAIEVGALCQVSKILKRELEQLQS